MGFALVKWDRRDTKFLGRNGHFNCRGVEVWVDDHSDVLTVRLSAITSKGYIGRSYIEIPAEKLLELQAAIEEALKAKGKGA